ncbi:MAG TPA: ATP/GTP-binding protein [Aldersonia sp.]
MPRRKPPSPPPPPLRALDESARRSEPGPGGDQYVVSTVTAARATKVYRCPGCDHEIAVGIAHVVAWPADDLGGVADRRHWHTGCWSGRRTRGLTRRWS